MPPVSYMGAGALTSAGAHIAGLGLKKALIVTDAVLKSCGAVSAVVDVLTLQGIESVIYDGVEPNPTVAQVEAGLAMLQAERCDCVVSFGGGSPHDAAKGIAAVATSGGSIRDYEGVDKLKVATLPLVAVNTTAGTASEMTRFAIITDVEVSMLVEWVGWWVRNRQFFFFKPRLPVPLPTPAPHQDGHHRLAHHAHGGGEWYESVWGKVACFFLCLRAGHSTPFSLPSNRPHPHAGHAQGLDRRHRHGRVDARGRSVRVDRVDPDHRRVRAASCSPGVPLPAPRGGDAGRHGGQGHDGMRERESFGGCERGKVDCFFFQPPPPLFSPQAYAEYLAGMAFNSAGLGYVHAMAHQLGGFYNLPRELVGKQRAG